MNRATPGEAGLTEAYRDAVERAAAETGLPVGPFPPECRCSADDLLAFDPAAEA